MTVPQTVRPWLVALAAAVAALSAVPDGRAERKTVVVRPTADARVESARPAANFGRARALGVQASPRARSYLRFDVADVEGTVVRATLRLFSRDRSDVGYSVRRAGPDWRERTITWKNAPSLGRVKKGSGAVRAGRWSSVDVTSFVGETSSVSLALVTGDRTRIRFRSREVARQYRPRLVLVVDVPPSGSPPPECFGGGDSAVLTPAADAYVSSSYPNRNFGSARTLRVRVGTETTPAWQTYLEFSPCTLAGPIASATLRLFVVDAARSGGSVYAVADSWAEATITWRNAPPLVGEPLAAVGRASLATWIDVELPADAFAAASVEPVLLALRSDVAAGGSAWYSSREGVRPPKLILTASPE
jgi:hypothetical protein